jgi:hypothetical protein
MATAVKQVSPPAVRGGFDRTAWNIEDRAKLTDGPIDAGKQGRVNRSRARGQSRSATSSISGLPASSATRTPSRTCRSCRYWSSPSR